MTKNEDNKRRPMAAAIEYDGEKDLAPRVTAKGEGLIAERIIELAKQHDIPIKSDPNLVQVLSKLDINEQIPVDLYRAIAEILAFVYSLNSKWQERQSS
ncbi:MAG: Flagellar biosynthetic protein FlhB [Syntrophus sp. SKADARSKE-3]|nr:Flagellar biosynthetic protein FlhB [Syntrophus sp. SKADARSKE-3]